MADNAVPSDHVVWITGGKPLPCAGIQVVDIAAHDRDELKDTAVEVARRQSRLSRGDVLPSSEVTSSLDSY